MRSKREKTPELKFLGKKIRQARKQKKWTQAIIAKALNCDISLIQKWEYGQREPSGLTLINLNKLLGLDLFQN